MSNWYVLHTRSAQEQRVADYLVARMARYGLPVPPEPTFNPTETVIISRRREVVRPYFPRYIFTCVDLSDGDVYYCVSKTPGLFGIVRVGGRLAILEQMEIDFIRAHTMDSFRGITPNARVQIKSGLNAGLTGLLEKRLKGSDRVRILLDAINGARQWTAIESLDNVKILSEEDQ